MFLICGSNVFGNIFLLKDSVSNIQRRNIIKVNFVKLPQTVLYLQYEFVYNRKITFALGTSVGSRKLPKFIYGRDKNGQLENFRFSGISITPELRIYPFNKKKGAPQGFYFAPYVKHSRYKLEFPVFYRDSADKEHRFDLEGRYIATGYGIMAGAQLVSRRGISLDFWILGYHYGSGKVALKANGDFTIFTSPAKEDIKGFIDESFSDLPLVGKYLVNRINIFDNEIKLTIDGVPYYGVRFLGFNLGYAF